MTPNTESQHDTQHQQKLPYEKPELSTYGNLAEITMGAGLSIDDSDIGNPDGGLQPS